MGDVVYSGNWFFFVEAKELGIRVRPEYINDLVQAGNAIRNQFRKEFDFIHPTNPDVSTKLLGPIIIDTPFKNKEANQNNILVKEGREYDRSPCGTGTCGRMAALFSKNKLGLNEDFINESIIGTTYKGRLIKQTKIGEYTAVIGEVTGNAYIMGFSHLVLDPDDCFGAHGFKLD